tara:strand:- start:252 stop:1304 length:1053 start_codon:yes stop_codon:yes gene_type:complete
MTQTGGDIIGVGSYGCVFKPPLKCKNKTRKKKGISKLMNQENGFQELLITQQLSKKIVQIPKYRKYFVLSQNFCLLDKLSSKDERQMQRKCDESIANDYNDNKTLISQNQPYGGKNLYTVLKEKSDMSETEKLSFVVDITKKIKALINAIKHMHRLKVYHTDIKPQNMVWNKNTIKVIDWGLAMINIPEFHYNIVHFNRPYESILLGLDDGVNKTKVENYIQKEMKKFQEHISNEPIKTDQFIFFSTYPTTTIPSPIGKYVLMIANQCMKDGKFDKRFFTNNYYKKQDYWGLLYFFVDALRILDIESNSLNVKMLELCNLMVTGVKINTNDIIQKLDGITRISPTSTRQN